MGLGENLEILSSDYGLRRRTAFIPKEILMNIKAKLRKQADRLWFLKYLKDCCELCGKGGTLQGHHYYFKGSYGYLRYEGDNHITLCVGCHFVLHARDPKKIEEQIIQIRGQKWAESLKKKSQEQHQSFQTIGYYRKIIKELE